MFWPVADSANSTDSADSAQGTTSVALDAGPANYLPLDSEKSTATAAPSAYLHISLTDPLPADTTSIRPFADPSAFLPVSLTPPPSSSTLLPVQDDNKASASPSAPTPTPPREGDPPPSAFLPLSSADTSKAQAEMMPSSDFLSLAQGTSTPVSQQPSLRPPSSPSVPNAPSP